MEKILYYAAQKEDRAKMLSACMTALGMEFVEIQPVECGQQLGFLAGEKGFERKQLSLFALPPLIPEELMIFCGLSGGRLESVLTMLRGSGLSVSLKAVMTPYNMRWTLDRLYQELCAERAQFEKS